MCEICGHTPCLDGCPNAPERIMRYCDICDTEIYEGEGYYEIKGEIWCKSCIRECERVAEEETDE